MILVKLEHYTYMVDLLGHVGYVQEVKNLIMKCTINYMCPWRALLGACIIYGAVDMGNPLGEHIVKQILELSLENGTGYVMLSNIYVVNNNRHLCENAE
jgi:hypothetical protein